MHVNSTLKPSSCARGIAFINNIFIERTYTPKSVSLQLFLLFFLGCLCPLFFYLSIHSLFYCNFFSSFLLCFSFGILKVCTGTAKCCSFTGLTVVIAVLQKHSGKLKSCYIPMLICTQAFLMCCSGLCLKFVCAEKPCVVYIGVFFGHSSRRRLSRFFQQARRCHFWHMAQNAMCSMMTVLGCSAMLISDFASALSCPSFSSACQSGRVICF